MTPARAFELLTKLSVPIIAAGGVLTLIWLSVLLSGDQGEQRICNVAAGCRQGHAHLPGTAALCLAGLVLALVALVLVAARRRGRPRPAPVWRAAAWWRFGVAAPLLVTAAGLDYAALRILVP
ncbi:MAG: hypothetical protein ACJ73S_23485 [Mycobacteriales bacterium]